MSNTYCTPTYDITFEGNDKVRVFNKADREEYLGWVEVSPETGEYIAVSCRYTDARQIQFALDELKHIRQEVRA